MVDPQPLSDPRVLRAIAHPVRTRILEELSASGPIRAADVARQLGIPANQASFHLRQLAKYGLVEEAPEEARDKRDRVWRSTSSSLTVNLRDLSEAPGGKAAVRVFRQTKKAWSHHLVDRAYDTERPPGGGVFSSAEHVLKLSDDEVLELRQELTALVDSWTARTRSRDVERRTYVLFDVLQPYPTDHAE